MRITAIVIVLGVLLGGCAKGIDVTGDQLATMQGNSALAESECYAWLAEKAETDALAISNLTKEQQFMYLLFQQNMQMVAIATGNSTNPCGNGTNVYDMMARVTESANKANAEIIGDGLNVVKWIGSIWAAGTVLDAVQGTEITVSGEGNTSTVDQSSRTNVQTQTATEATGDNNNGNSLENPETSVEEPEPEEGGDYLGIPGCSSEESYLAGRCSEGPIEVE